MNNISTDEITPGWVCFYYDETLGEYVYVGCASRQCKRTKSETAILRWWFSGRQSCGSSRETAPVCGTSGGVQLVIAQTIEKIYGQNSQNIGLLTSTDFGLIERIERGEEIPLEEFTRA